MAVSHTLSMLAFRSFDKVPVLYGINSIIIDALVSTSIPSFIGSFYIAKTTFPHKNSIYFFPIICAEFTSCRCDPIIDIQFRDFITIDI